MRGQFPDTADGLISIQRELLASVGNLTRGRKPPAVKTFTLLDTVWKRNPVERIEDIFSALLEVTQPLVCRYPLFEAWGFWGSELERYALAPYYTDVGPRADPLGTLGAALRLLCNGARVHTGWVELLGMERQRPPRLRSPRAWNESPSGQRIGGKLLSFLPPHNRKAVLRALIERLESGRWDQGRIFTLIEGPDFATGGELRNAEALPEIYETGRGVLELCPLIQSESIQGDRRELRLTGLPLGTTWGDFLPLFDRRADTGVEEVLIRFSEKGLLLRLEKMREIAAEACISNLKSFTTTRFEVRMMAGGARPRLLTLRDLIDTAVENLARAAGSTRAALRRLKKAQVLKDPRRTVLSRKGNGLPALLS